MTDEWDTDPRPGLVVTYRNRDGTIQRYRCLRITPTRSKPIAVWRSRCAECGALFIVTTAPRARVVRHRQDALFATRCREHARGPIRK